MTRKKRRAVQRAEMFAADGNADGEGVQMHIHMGVRPSLTTSH